MEYKQSLGKLKAIGIVGIMQQPSVDIGCHKHQTDGYIFRDVNHVSRVIGCDDGDVVIYAGARSRHALLTQARPRGHRRPTTALIFDLRIHHSTVPAGIQAK